MANQRYEAFARVAETGSLKIAARDLGYTQSGIGYLITTLEREMGVPLIVRGYGSVRLTAEGRDLLPWVRAVCNGERQLSSRIAELKHLEGGTVHVAAFTSVAIRWFPSIAKSFLAKHPRIDLQLLCLDEESELEDALWRGDADCGFIVPPLKRPLEARPLYRDPVMVVLPPSHRLAGAEHISASELVDEPYIRLQSGPACETEQVLRHEGAEPHERFVVDNDYAVMSMVSAGLGFSVLPSLLLDSTPFPLAIVAPQAKIEREISIAARSMESASAAARAFIEETCAWVAKRYGSAERRR